MSFAAVVAGGVALTGTAINAIQAGKQRRAAERISVQDPGYEVNPALRRNAEVLRSRANNYVMPGTSQALRDIDRAGEAGFQAGIQGATSSNDVLDMAARTAYGTQSARARLASQQASGQDAALMDYLSAEAQAGQGTVDQNAWEREQYLRKERQRAELANASIANTSNAIQSGLSTVGQVATAKLGGVGNRKLTPEEYAQMYYNG